MQSSVDSLVNAAETESVVQLRAMTQQLLDSARAGEWEVAAAIESERRPLLYLVFGQVEQGTHARHRALLNEILAADREIIQRAQSCREELADMLRRTGTGRAAVRAYGANSP